MDASLSSGTGLVRVATRAKGKGRSLLVAAILFTADRILVRHSRDFRPFGGVFCGVVAQFCAR